MNITTQTLNYKIRPHLNHLIHSHRHSPPFGSLSVDDLYSPHLTPRTPNSIQAWATKEAQSRLEQSGEWEKIRYKPSGSEGSVGV